MYIGGQFLVEKDISPPLCNGMSFEDKVKERDWYLQKDLAEMKRTYYGAMQKLEWRIDLVVEWELGIIDDE